MRKPKEKKEELKMKSVRDAKEMYLIYMDGIMYIELKEGLGFNKEF